MSVHLDHENDEQYRKFLTKEVEVHVCKLASVSGATA
jgi:hypothetical protein